LGKLVNSKEGAALLQEHFRFGSAKSLAKLRTIGGGPPFLKCGPRLVVYDSDDLLAWARARISERPFTSTTDAGSSLPRKATGERERQEPAATA
jgi:hypothetical protein